MTVDQIEGEVARIRQLQNEAQDPLYADELGELIDGLLDQLFTLTRQDA